MQARVASRNLSINTAGPPALKCVLVVCLTKCACRRECSHDRKSLRQKVLRSQVIVEFRPGQDDRTNVTPHDARHAGAMSRQGQPTNIVDRPLPKGKSEVSLSAFSFLFSELVQYHRTRASSIAELEQKLSEAGEGVGSRMLEVLAYRDKSNRREIRLQGILHFINTNVWRCLFGKVADSLEIYNDDEYVLGDKSLVVNRYISVPKDFGDLNCGAFAAGVVKGVLVDAGFPAEVSAYYAEVDGQRLPKTNILMKFAPEVMEREKRLGGA